MGVTAAGLRLEGSCSFELVVGTDPAGSRRGLEIRNGIFLLVGLAFTTFWPSPRILWSGTTWDEELLAASIVTA